MCRPSSGRATNSYSACARAGARVGAARAMRCAAPSPVVIPYISRDVYA